MEPSGLSSFPTPAKVTSAARHRDPMTDAELQNYLRENGYPEHIVREGREGLLRRYREFVEQVERGYKLGLEDYRNDLDLRGILALAGIDAPELDERLREQLVATCVPVWDSNAGAHFW